MSHSNTPLSKYGEFGERYKRLGQKLSKIPQVTRYDSKEAKEEWTLAHSFLDLEECFEKFVNVFLPKLENEDLDDKEIYNLLLDIGEDFRHIIYHLNDPEFFRYLGTAKNEDKGV